MSDALARNLNKMKKLGIWAGSGIKTWSSKVCTISHSPIIIIIVVVFVVI